MNEETKRWLKQAEKDFGTAKADVSIRKYSAACFWCQQSIENAMKALLIEQTNDFPKIHDLAKLARMNNAPEEIVIPKDINY